MSTLLINTLAFIVAISVLVAVHEFGHYLVGRWCGMKVLRFSIGFGRPIVSWFGGKDRTEYCISNIPLGGYVKFLDEREGPVEPSDEGRAFNHRPIAARIAVLLAGPFFNFVFACVAYWALFVSGVPTVIPMVGEVTEGTYAADAGLEFGDRIVRVGDREAADWETALISILDEMVATGRVPLRLEDQQGRIRDTVLEVGAGASRLTEPNMLFDGLGFEPWRPPALIGEVSASSAAEAGGIVAGDRITAIDGENITTFEDLRRVVAARPDQPVSVSLVRAGETLQLDLVLGSTTEGGERRGLLGVNIDRSATDYWYVRRHAPLDAIGQALERTWGATGFTVRMFGRMLTGDVSIRNISGPINIAQFAGDSASRGLPDFLNFLALVSISLGVINLLPIPILDGGQIVYQLVELVKGAPLSERSQLVGQQVGILALLLLMSFAFYNDIARLFG